MFCNKCGQQIPDNAAFCPKCGQAANASNVTTAPPAPAPVYQQPAPVCQQPVYQGQPVYPGQPAAVVAVKPKKHGGLIAFLIVVIVLLAGFIAVTFLVPGLVRPAGLGVKSTYEGYVSALNKLGLSKDEAPASGTAEQYLVSYSGSHEVDTALTSEEITSYINQNRPPYFALKDVQIRINDDGTVEASGKLVTAYVFEKVLNGDYTMDDAKRALPMLGLIPANVNLYVKLSGGMTDNHIENLAVQSVSVMGISIPVDLINTNESFIVETLDDYIGRTEEKSGADIERISIEGGKLNLKGTLPSSVERIPVQ